MKEGEAAWRLVAEGLTAIRGGRALFAELSFAAAAREVIAITGPNGAGKTTLLRILAGFARADAGTVRFLPGNDAPDGTALHFFGHADGLKPALSVLENLTFWQNMAGEAAMPVEDALGEWGLAPLADIPVAYLSAGQRRRAGLARLRLNHRPIWLLDEPTAALDTEAQARLGRAIDSHAASGGLVIAATHQPLPATVTRSLPLGPVA